MLRKRIISVLTIYDGILFRTKEFKPDYRYTMNFIDSWLIDEIVLLDITRYKNKKNNSKFLKIVEEISSKCFVPMAVGGGIRSIDDVKSFMACGADKVIINTGAIINPELITNIASTYGRQSLIVSIDVKKSKVFSNYGSKPTILSPLSWSKEVVTKGAGEIMLNSIDRDGSLTGYDVELCRLISENISVPLLISGGAGNWKHFEEGFLKGKADAVCTTNIYHFTEKSIKSAKNYLKSKNISVRI